MVTDQKIEGKSYNDESDHTFSSTLFSTTIMSRFLLVEGAGFSLCPPENEFPIGRDTAASIRIIRPSVYWRKPSSKALQPIIHSPIVSRRNPTTILKRQVSEVNRPPEAADAKTLPNHQKPAIIPSTTSETKKANLTFTYLDYASDMFRHEESPTDTPPATLNASVATPSVTSQGSLDRSAERHLHDSAKRSMLSSEVRPLSLPKRGVTWEDQTDIKKPRRDFKQTHAGQRVRIYSNHESNRGKVFMPIGFPRLIQPLLMVQPTERRSSQSLGQSIKISTKKRNCCCRKSQCLKRYCECYAGGETCSSTCRCYQCFNLINISTKRMTAVESITRGKSVLANTHQTRSSEKNVSKKSASCRCKESHCLKRYCVCYFAGAKCSDGCGCTGCKNST